jgi:Sulfotransferase family
MNKPRLAIVGGCGSSGTTLLAHLLSRHPEIASGPEFNCFNHKEIYDLPLLRQRYRSMLKGNCEPFGYIDVHVFMTHRDYYAINAEQIEGRVRTSNSAQEFIYRIADHVTAHLGKPMFVEKSPTNVYSFKILAEQYSEVPLIHVIRDGRDVATSLRRRGFNLFAAGTRWLFDTMAGLAARKHSNYLEIRYEDLVQSPAEVLQKIFLHLGVDLETDVLRGRSRVKKGVYTEDWKMRSVPQAWQQTPDDPISTASVGRYKRVLTAQELSILDRITLNKKGASRLGCEICSFGQLLRELGYTPNSVHVQKHGAVKVREFLLQLSDYNRLLSRAHDNRRWRLPTPISYIHPSSRV